MGIQRCTACLYFVAMGYFHLEISKMMNECMIMCLSSKIAELQVRGANGHGGALSHLKNVVLHWCSSIPSAIKGIPGMRVGFSKTEEQFQTNCILGHRTTVNNESEALPISVDSLSTHMRVCRLNNGIGEALFDNLCSHIVF